MSSHSATVKWLRGNQQFLDNKYSREHTWVFDGGSSIAASSSPLVVPVPYSNPASVDPEEAFIASLASCHMLWFLSIASKRGIVIDGYEDEALGTVAKVSNGKLAIVDVELRPKVTLVQGSACERALLDLVHNAAHHECFLARSVNFPVRITPRW